MLTISVDTFESGGLSLFTPVALSASEGVMSEEVDGGGCGFRPLFGRSASGVPSAKNAGLTSCNLLTSDLTKPSLVCPVLILICDLDILSITGNGPDQEGSKPWVLWFFTNTCVMWSGRSASGLDGGGWCVEVCTAGMADFD